MWKSFAKDRNCSLDPIYYEMIERTLNYYRNSTHPNERSITTEQIIATRKQEGLWPIYKSPSLQNQLVIIPQLTWLTFMQHFQSVLPINFQMFINMNDEPRVAPIITPNPHQSTYRGGTYQSTSQLFEMNRCFQQKHQLNKQKFSLFLAEESAESFVQEYLPIFTQSTHDCFLDLLIPTSDHFAAASTEENHPNLLTYDEWKKKSSLFVWRGSTHGVWWTQNTPYWNSQRHRFVSLIHSLQQQNSTYRRLFNVSFSQYSTCEPSICHQMRKQYGPPSFISRVEQRNTFRYVFDIDGAGWTNRFLSLLGDGVLILKATYSYEYLSSFILPYVHYIPLAPDYSDLIPQIEWVLSHEEEVYQIVRRAQEISRRRLRKADLECYLSRMILEYSSLLREDIPPY